MLNRLYNFHWVVIGEAARSSQSHIGFLGRLLKDHGLKAVINLRGQHKNFRWWRYETKVCASMGVEHFDTMLDSRRLPLKKMLVTLFAAFDVAKQPLLLKCAGGQDRSSLASALYILHRKGWDAFDEAMNQFAREPYRHTPRAGQRWLQQFPIYAREQAKGVPIADWIRGEYDPEDLHQWLDAKGLRDASGGIFVPKNPDDVL